MLRTPNTDKYKRIQVQANTCIFIHVVSYKLMIVS